MGDVVQLQRKRSVRIEVKEAAPEKIGTPGVVVGLAIGFFIGVLTFSVIFTLAGGR